MERSSSYMVTICDPNIDLNFGLSASVSSSRLLVLELCGYTNMTPVYVKYQESSCLIYAWEVEL